jgi:copper chaperone CopZ
MGPRMPGHDSESICTGPPLPSCPSRTSGMGVSAHTGCVPARRPAQHASWKRLRRKKARLPLATERTLFPSVVHPIAQLPLNSRLAPAEQAATWTVPFPIDGMTCASCTSDITNAMSRQQGISHFQVDLMSETQTSRPQTRARQTPPERRSRTSATTTRSCRSSQSLFHANLQHHSPSTAPILPSEA